DLRDPAACTEADVGGLLVVGVKRRLNHELHREPEAVVVLRADLVEHFELLDPGDRGELALRGLDEILLLRRTGGVLEGEYDCVPDTAVIQRRHGRAPYTRARHGADRPSAL